MGSDSTIKIHSPVHKISMYVILHQIGFLLTGLCTTLGVQWLFYRGAATSMSLLPQLSTYTGMLLVGLFIPILLRKKRKQASDYKLMIEQEQPPSPTIIPTIENNTVIHSSACSIQSEHTITVDYSPIEDIKKLDPIIKEEGPIHHLSIIKLASLEIVAGLTLTVGFSVIGSGMYQVIYSSVVVWCAILTFLFMGRALSKVQWVAIIGTSIGLGVSSLDSLIKNSTTLLVQDDMLAIPETSSRVLLNGTIMTLLGTFISACMYVYADNILSKNKVQPLPARVCLWMGVYTSIFTWIWISVYTIPQFNEIIHIDQDICTLHVVLVYAMITIANALHSWSYYELIERTGNVATGILQGLRAILVYGLSHIWYCSEDSAQCFTTSKGCGSLIVISCVLLFTLGKK